MKFHTVAIIYNPNSTGDSKRKSYQLQADLESLGYQGDVVMAETQFAGHGEEIARDYAPDSGVLIVSSSGDGGYNEVVNGVLHADGEACVAVLPSGNANDHASSLQSDGFVQHIIDGKTTNIDCMKVTAVVTGKRWVRYAHSYVGFGMTPSVGRLLTEKRPGVLMEKWYVLRHVLRFKHVTLKRAGRKLRFTNLVTATIPKMSKIVQLDEASSVTDGKMEVYETKYVGKFKALMALIGVGINGIASEASVERLELDTVRSTLVQLDGEVERIDANSSIEIVCCHRLLKTIL